MKRASEISALQAMVKTLRAQAQSAGHRRLLVLSGGREWGANYAGLVSEDFQADRVIWIGAEAPHGLQGRSGRDVLRLLGSETDLLVVNVWTGFDPDAVGGATGMVTAGGLVVLVIPPLEEWPAYPDPELRRISIDGAAPAEIGHRFIQRLVGILEQDRHAVLVREGWALPEPSPSTPGRKPPPPTGACRTHDQAQAVDAILQVVSGHRRRPLVLTADRGRGKSAALGLAVARLEQQGETDMLVTAPDASALEAVFRHAGADTGLRYLPPDRVLKEHTAARLLLVDEAAGLPVASLMELVRTYPRVVFSSTVHGYEGTGRGFAVRFRDRLQSLAPGGRILHLETPIRWAPGDPVEHFTFRALLLDAAMAPLPEKGKGDEVVVKALDRDWLLDHPRELEQLFGLLVQAHYRTRPLDLRNLLDGPRITVLAAFQREAVVGAVLVVREGGFDPVTADAIWMGLRRPHGHLLPQSLAAHVGMRLSPVQQMLRIMRIAVHPLCQRRDIGRRLVGAVATLAAETDVSIMGASFGATPELLNFWQQCDLLPVRVGTRRDPASGTHSVLMIRALNGSALVLLEDARERFAQEMPAQLSDPLRKLEGPVVSGVLAGLPAAIVPGTRAWEDTAAFAWGRRDFDVCLSSLRAVSWWGLVSPSARKDLEPMQMQVLLQRVLQGWGWQDVAKANGLPGRAGVLQVLRQALRTVMQAGAPADLLSDPLFADDGNP